jgi:hypothetical protein
MVSSDSTVFGSFVILHVGKVLWFTLMNGGVGMFLLDIHDKQTRSAGTEVKPRMVQQYLQQYGYRRSPRLVLEEPQ